MVCELGGELVQLDVLEVDIPSIDSHGAAKLERYPMDHSVCALVDIIGHRLVHLGHLCHVLSTDKIDIPDQCPLNTPLVLAVDVEDSCLELAQQPVHLGF